MTTVLTSAQITVCDLADPVVSGAEPSAPVIDMLWMDTSQTPSVLKRWTGAEWEVVNEQIVGGTNLMRGTQYWTDDAFQKDDEGNVLSGTAVINETVLTVDSASVEESLCCGHKIPVTGGGKYMLGFDVSGETAGTYEVMRVNICQLNDEDDAEKVLSVISISENITAYWTRKTKSITVPDEADYVYFIFQPEEDGTRYQYVKFEEGTVATSWNPAPEDFYAETNKITTLVQKVENTQTDQEYRIGVTEQHIESIDGSIVSINEKQSTMVNDINSVTTSFSTFKNGTEETLSWFRMGVDENNEPILEIGEKDNPVIMHLTNDRLSFLYNNVEVSYMSDSRMYNSNLVVNNSFTFGPFQGIVDDNGVSWI